MKRIFGAARLRTLMCLSLILYLTCSANAQVHPTTEIFNFSKHDATLDEILATITKQTGYFFIQHNGDAIYKKTIHVNYKNYPLQTFLDSLPAIFGLTCSPDKDDPHTLHLMEINKLQASHPIDQSGPRDFEGTILNEKHAPLEGISVNVIGTNRTTTTNHVGKFRFNNMPTDAVLSLSGIPAEPREVKVTNSWSMTIIMKTRITTLEEERVVSTGYERKLKAFSVFASDAVPPSLIERSTSANVLTRLENLASGVLINHGGQSSDGSSLPATLFIRGFSTIYANANPLVVVDNFIFQGDINSINPDDVDNITILKDASATAIWGVRAGNGVIVITTKKGSTKRPRWVFNNTLTYTAAPDVFNMKTISSSEYIEFEKDRYAKGYYVPDLSGPSNYNPVTPVVGLLHAAEQGTVSPSAAAASIQAMKNYDVRKDIQKYFYRPALNQHVSAQFSGQTRRLNYFGSAGLDQDPANLTDADFRRVTGRAQASYKMSRRLQLSFATSYADIVNRNGNNPGYNYLSPRGKKTFYPYARLVDGQGHPLPVFLDYNQDYLQSTNALGFLDNTWYPGKDMNEESHQINIRNLMADLALRYNILPHLQLDIKYEFQAQTNRDNDLHTSNSYFARDLINTFTQVDPSTGRLSYPIPLGGIADKSFQKLTSHQARIQLSYRRNWVTGHELSLTGGAEIQSSKFSGSSHRQYGVGNPSAPATINDSTPYVSNIPGEIRNIPAIALDNLKTDHFASLFANGTYTFNGLYAIAVNTRWDQSDYFGTSINGKPNLLGSVGLAWYISRENFFPTDWMPVLTLRASTGKSGNIATQASPQATISPLGASLTGTPYPVSYITNPPNAQLRGESVRITNLAVDFATRNHFLKGTIEYYLKNPYDLVVQVANDPTYGGVQTPGARSSYLGNNASVKERGIDIDLTSNNLRGRIQWVTNLLLSKVTSVVTKLSYPASLGNSYLTPNTPNPMPGHSLYGLYSFQSYGLDAHTGDPVGYINGQHSTDYTTIYNNTTRDSMIYNGPSQPTIFGAMRNTFVLDHFSLSFNISFKLGYYFKLPALNYSDLSNHWSSTASYTNRWQAPGDERHTSVPSFNPVAGIGRDLFYANSSVMVDRADNIRLEDIILSYNTRRLQLFTNFSNLGILWKANKAGIDPYYVNVPKNGISISLGAKAFF